VKERPPSIWFCGVATQEIAQETLICGLKPGNWISTYMGDALEGGPYLFEIALSVDPDGFGFVLEQLVPPDRIVSYTVYHVHKVLENPILRRQVREANREVQAELARRWQDIK
jgi:hypothetical protein